MSLLVPINLAKGVFVAHFTEHGLARLDWPNKEKSRAESRKPMAALPSKVNRWILQTRAALERVLAGKSPRSFPPLDLAEGTTFQQQVWKSLREIPPGETRSYAQLAAAIGRPQAARAVGNACGANPIPLLIPCHRVVPSGGGLGGFSGPIEWKRKLLEAEGK